MKMIGNGLRLIRVFFRLVFEMIRNYKKLNNDPDHNFLICKEICQKIVESAKIQLEIVQKEALPKLENFLLVSNHRCFFDVVFLLAAIEDTISFVAAKELWHYPILSRYLDSIGCVALERGAKKPEMINNAVHRKHSIPQDIAETAGAISQKKRAFAQSAEQSYKRRSAAACVKNIKQNTIMRPNVCSGYYMLPG